MGLGPPNGLGVVAKMDSVVVMVDDKRRALTALLQALGSQRGGRLRSCMQALTELLGIDFAAVLFASAQGRVESCRCYGGDGRFCVGQRLDLGDVGDAVVVADGSGESFLRPLLAENPQTRSVLSVPVPQRGRRRGRLVLMDHQADAFDEESVALVVSFAGLLGALSEQGERGGDAVPQTIGPELLPSGSVASTCWEHRSLIDAISEVQRSHIEERGEAPLAVFLRHLLNLTRGERAFVAEVNPCGSCTTVETFPVTAHACAPEGQWAWLAQLAEELGQVDMERGVVGAHRSGHLLESDHAAFFALRSREGLVGVAGVGRSFAEFAPACGEALRPLLTTCANVLTARRLDVSCRASQAEATRLSEILEQAHEMVVVDRHKGECLQANERFLRKLGFALPTLTGMPLDHLFIEESGAVHGWLLGLDGAGGADSTREMRARCADGSTYEVAVQARRVGHSASLVVLILEDLSSRRISAEHLSFLETHDALTGLYNRVGFLGHLELAVEAAQEQEGFFAVLFLDLDRFQAVNDTLGHEVGDSVVVQTARRLAALVGEGDVLARQGGDEFLILLAGGEPITGVAQFAESIMGLFTEPFDCGEQEVFLSASVGVSIFPIDATDSSAILRNADTALAHAKRAGRGTYRFFTTYMNARATERLALDAQLRRALERNELDVYYQPQINLKTGRITGVEALARWNHPRLGPISPSAFIPLAEENGFIVALGEWVLERACRQVQKWHLAGHAYLQVAVNLSARQAVEAILPRLHQVLRETCIDPCCVEFELTESLLVGDHPGTMQALRALQAYGVSFSIDDFGTGYSSLGYLKQLPIDTLKIDRSFMNDVNRNPDDAAIAKAIIAMAHGLGMRVIAEGVETRAQLEFLAAHNCDAFQGYYFSPPLPAEELTRLLQEGRTLSDVQWVNGPSGPKH